jgi:hypothetical protein
MTDYDDSIQMFIVPAKGKLLRNPESKEIIPDSGSIVPKIGPEGRYWRRRINQGDAVEVPKASQAEAETRKQRKGGGK